MYIGMGLYNESICSNEFIGAVNWGMRIESRVYICENHIMSVYMCIWCTK